VRLDRAPPQRAWFVGRNSDVGKFFELRIQGCDGDGNGGLLLVGVVGKAASLAGEDHPRRGSGAARLAVPAAARHTDTIIQEPSFFRARRRRRRRGIRGEQDRIEGHRWWHHRTGEGYGSHIVVPRGSPATGRRRRHFVLGWCRHATTGHNPSTEKTRHRVHSSSKRRAAATHVNPSIHLQDTFAAVDTCEQRRSRGRATTIGWMAGSSEAARADERRAVVKKKNK